MGPTHTHTGSRRGTASLPAVPPGRLLPSRALPSRDANRVLNGPDTHAHRFEAGYCQPPSGASGPVATQPSSTLTGCEQGPEWARHTRTQVRGGVLPASQRCLRAGCYPAELYPHGMRTGSGMGPRWFLTLWHGGVSVGSAARASLRRVFLCKLTPHRWYLEVVASGANRDSMGGGWEQGFRASEKRFMGSQPSCDQAGGTRCLHILHHEVFCVSPGPW